MTRSRLLLVLLLLAPAAFAARRHAALPPAQPAAEGLLASQPVAVGLPVVGPTWGREHNPHIAAGPSQALVVWSGTKAARISADGEVLDVPPIALPAFDGPFDVAWNGSRYLVATSAYEGSGFETRLIAVSTTSAVTIVARVPEVAPLSSIAIAARGDGVLVVRGVGYAPSYTAEALYFDRNGDLSGRVDLGSSVAVARLVAGADGYLGLSSGRAWLIGDGNATPIDLSAADAAWTGDGWTAVSGGKGLTITRVLPDGQIASSPLRRESPFGAWAPSIAWNGSEYRVVWKEQKSESDFYSYPKYDTMMARLTPANFLDDAVLAGDTDVSGRFAIGIDRTAVAAIGRSFLAVWTRNVAPTIETRDVFVAFSLTGEPPRDAAARTQLVTRKLPAQTIAALAVQPGAARVFWNETRTSLGLNALRTSSIAQSGDRSPELEVTPATYAAAAAFNGIDTLAVWRKADNEGGIVGRRIALDGSFVDPQPFLIAPTGQTALAVACAARDCAVVWSVAASNGTPTVSITRVDPSGAILDAQPLVIPNTFAGIAARGDDYLIVRHNLGYIFSAVVHDGGLSPERLIANDGAATIASRGREWLVAVFNGANVHTVRMAPDGEVAGWEDFTVSAGTSGPPRLAWNGRHWLLAWTASSDVRGARLDDEGRLIDEFGIAATPDAESLDAVGSIADGTAAVAYTRAGRAYVKWLTDLR